jgi:hypothetical protein
VELRSDVPKTGGEVDAWCTKCKMDLAHTVVAMVGRDVVKVMCRTCGSYHRYHAPKTEPKPTKPTRAPARSSGASGTKSTSAPAKSRETATPANDARRWEQEVAGDAEGFAAARPYSMREPFEPGEWMDHVRFGQGKVLSQKDATKVQVLFRDGERTLVVNRA